MICCMWDFFDDKAVSIGIIPKKTTDKYLSFFDGLIIFQLSF